MSTEQTLSAKQQAIAPIAAFTAVGNMPKLHTALNKGLDAGLTISDAKEILVQLYAYAGFPRSLNALGELMKVLDAAAEYGGHAEFCTAFAAVQKVARAVGGLDVIEACLEAADKVEHRMM